MNDRPRAVPTRDGPTQAKAAAAGKHCACARVLSIAQASRHGPPLLVQLQFMPPSAAVSSQFAGTLIAQRIQPVAASRADEVQR